MWHDISKKSARFSDENRAVIVQQGDTTIGSYNELRLEKISGEYHVREEYGDVDVESALEYLMKDKDVDEVYGQDGEVIASMGMEFNIND